MRIGIAASIGGHLAIGAWAFLSLSTAERIPERKAIPVELVQNDAPAKDAPGKKDAAAPAQGQDAKPASPPGQGPPPQPGQREGPSSPAPAESDNPAAGDAAPKPPSQTPASPENHAEDTELAAIAALIERNLSGGGVRTVASTGLATSGRATTLAQETLDGLSAQARRCWDVPAGWTDRHQVTVTVRFGLNKDGTVKGTPDVVEFPASPLGKLSADNAVTAVLRCGPYRLPPEKYDEWKDVQLRFVPGP